MSAAVLACLQLVLAVHAGGEPWGYAMPHVVLYRAIAANKREEQLAFPHHVDHPQPRHRFQLHPARPSFRFPEDDCHHPQCSQHLHSNHRDTVADQHQPYRPALLLGEIRTSDDSHEAVGLSSESDGVRHVIHSLPEGYIRFPDSPSAHRFAATTSQTKIHRHFYKGVPVYESKHHEAEADRTYDPRFIALYRLALQIYHSKHEPVVVKPSTGEGLSANETFRPSAPYYKYSEPDPLYHPNGSSLITYPTKPQTTPAPVTFHPSSNTPTAPTITTTVATPVTTEAQARPHFPDSINAQLPPVKPGVDIQVPYVSATAITRTDLSLSPTVHPPVTDTEVQTLLNTTQLHKHESHQHPPSLQTGAPPLSTVISMKEKPLLPTVTSMHEGTYHSATNVSLINTLVNVKDDYTNSTTTEEAFTTDALPHTSAVPSVPTTLPTRDIDKYATTFLAAIANINRDITHATLESVSITVKNNASKTVGPTRQSPGGASDLNNTTSRVTKLSRVHNTGILRQNTNPPVNSSTTNSAQESLQSHTLEADQERAENSTLSTSEQQVREHETGAALAPPT